jgi:hypothetical protein
MGGVCRVGYEYLGIEKWPVIFCCSDDGIIMSIVAKVAFDHHVRVWHNTCDGDVMGIPCNIAVINRKLLGEGAWENYIDWQRELDDPETTLFIYVDKDPYREERVPVNRKSFYEDFGGDYKKLLEFLDTQVGKLMERE